MFSGEVVSALVCIQTIDLIYVLVLLVRRKRGKDRPWIHELYRLLPVPYRIGAAGVLLPPKIDAGISNSCKSYLHFIFP